MPIFLPQSLIPESYGGSHSKSTMNTVFWVVTPCSLVDVSVNLLAPLKGIKVCQAKQQVMLAAS
jgi:hypothetical protein